MFGIKDNISAPVADENGGDDAGAAKNNITGNEDASICDEALTVEADEATYLLPPNIYRGEIEKRLGIVHPNTTIDANRLGRNVQREKITHVGREERAQIISGQNRRPFQIVSEIREILVVRKH